MRKQFNPETTRRVFILEYDQQGPWTGKWSLTCHDTAWIARLCLSVPRWILPHWFHVESARMGYNTTDYVKICYGKPNR
jgi:hypothetical protein